MPLARQHIAVGVIYSESREKVLVTKRPVIAHMGGLWEFPGGKVRDNEDVLTALKRELFEELDLEVGSAHPLIQIEHDYFDKHVKLDVWVIDDWKGNVYGKEGQELEWTWITQLRQKEFPCANTAIINAIALPSLYLITPDFDSYDEIFVNTAKALIENGVKLIQFRSKKTSFISHEKTARELVEICNKNKGIFIYNGTPEEALKLDAHGVHLNSHELLRCDKRPLTAKHWVAASCHNLEELNHAVEIGVDFCVLSPIYETTSHRDNKSMGWEIFEHIAGKSRIPVYALGGMKPADMGIALRHKAQGIAMISGIWNAQDPVKAVRNCLKSP